MFNVKLVCEGITDQIILEAVLSAYLQSDKFTVNCIQPESSKIEGNPYEHGTGWKGVRSWCQMVQEEGGLEAVEALQANVDLLVIHVDAEIVFEAEHDGLSQPCPPPDHNIQTTEALVKSWLGLKELPDRVIIWVPSMMTEAWVIRALHPEIQLSESCLNPSASPSCIECIDNPKERLLGLTPKLVRRRRQTTKNGKTTTEIKPYTKKYQEISVSIAKAWPDLVRNIWSAARLQEQLHRALPIPS